MRCSPEKKRILVAEARICVLILKFGCDLIVESVSFRHELLGFFTSFGRIPLDDADGEPDEELSFVDLHSKDADSIVLGWM